MLVFSDLIIPALTNRMLSDKGMYETGESREYGRIVEIHTLEQMTQRPRWISVKAASSAVAASTIRRTVVRSNSLSRSES